MQNIKRHRALLAALATAMAILVSSCAQTSKPEPHSPDEIIQTEDQAIKAAVKACFEDNGGIIPTWNWVAEYEHGTWRMSQHSADTYGVIISAKTGDPLGHCGMTTE